MTHPELERERLLSEHRLHLKNRIAESDDPNLSLVQIEALSVSEIEAWGSFRDILSALEKRAKDETLTDEAIEEITEKFSQLTVKIKQCPRESKSQSNFAAFINNMRGLEDAITMMAKDGEEWPSYYKDLLSPIIEKYK